MKSLRMNARKLNSTVVAINKARDNETRVKNNLNELCTI